MKLKQVLVKCGESQKALATAIGLSPASVAQLVNHGQWPKTLDAEQIKQKVREFLKDSGASQSDMDTAFESEEPERCCALAPVEASLTKEEVMLLRRQGLYPAAKKHFGFFRDPFADDVQSHEDIFVSPDIRYVREAVFQTSKHGGFMAVIAESGAGKSTIRRDLIDRIGRESHSIVVIEPYVLGMEDNDQKGKTLKAAHIAEAVINTVSPLEHVKRSPEARFRQLHKVLRDSRRAGNSHVLIIEEAHGLSIPTIKHLKRFFELEDGFKKLLSIILIGQPELKLKLSESNHEVREVVQRCEVVELKPLDSRLEEYLKFKFDRINKPLGDVIDTTGIEAIRAKLTISTNRRSGNRVDSVSLLYPLAIGNLLTACMNLAAEIGVPKVNADVVREV
jgi:type II secretory pathway predicted ATPase ExeA